MLRVLYLEVLRMSAAASVVILVVLFARLLLRKAPRIFSYVLWAAVLFRLLCPVAVQAPVGAVPQAAHIWEASVQAVEPAPGTRAAGYAAARKARIRQQGYAQAAACIWLLGSGGMLAVGGIKAGKLRRRLVGAARLRENIYLADHIALPFVMGTFRPRIYLPSALSAQERSYIIVHEQQHIQRRDPLLRLLAFAALCIHWFNPLVWAAYVLSGRDMEISCDEAVLKTLGAGVRADYSASLLNLAAGRRVITGTPPAFSGGDTKGRVIHMSRWKKPKKWVQVAAALFCLLVLVACAVDAPALDRTPGSVSSTVCTDTACTDPSHHHSRAGSGTSYTAPSHHSSGHTDSHCESTTHHSGHHH